MTLIARILYENGRNADRHFALHDLLCAMVDDMLEESVGTARTRIDGMPRGGRDRLIGDCRERRDDVFAGFPATHRFALVDGDEIHQHLAITIPASASLAERRVALTTACPGVQMYMPDGAHPRESNTEGILRVVVRCLGLALDAPDAAIALEKKKGAANRRDILLNKAAWGPRAPRDCIRLAQPTLANLVDALADLSR